MTRTLPRTALYALTLLPAVAQADELPDAKAREEMAICTDGKSHYVALAPDSHVTTRLYYGDGKRFFAVPPSPGGMMTGDWFQDPRRYSKTNNPSFRGLDLRLFSRVELDKDKKTCAVVCGEKKTELQILDPQKAKAVVGPAKFEASPRKWAPYALARDDKGNYYYVDRGFAEADKGRYRLFVGPKGALKKQQMTNTVSDSEGDIFATKTGSLRLILDRNESSWVENDKARTLRLVPVDANLPMIYNELGIYTGERLGTPCDDF